MTVCNEGVDEWVITSNELTVLSEDMQTLDCPMSARSVIICCVNQATVLSHGLGHDPAFSNSLKALQRIKLLKNLAKYCSM